MAEGQTDVERDRQSIADACKKGTLGKLVTYTRLSGPGWLQSAITLGGGSLGSSLYLGILAGFALLWLQPLAMILGVVMLSAIGYVALSTGERPFDAINRHVNPVLGWGWAIATLMANLVWAMPQFTLGTSSIRENLLPGLFGGMDVNHANIILGVAIVVICTVVVWFYDTGSKGIKAFEIILKIMVAVIIICFFGVVVKMSVAGGLDWGAIGRGIVPNIRLLWSPAETFTPYLNAVGSEFGGFWRKMIVSMQRDVMISAAATAVGINMTFLLPYSMLKRGWDRTFRGLAIFDLSTGLFVPFILATGCVVIASASQFHARTTPGFLGEKDEKGALVVPHGMAKDQFESSAWKRVRQGSPEAAAPIDQQTKALEDDKGLDGKERAGKISALRKPLIDALPEADRRIAAMLIKRDAFDLADSLRPLTGKGFSHYVFGIGVIGMAISSIIILMLINGFVVCEMLGRPSQGWLYRLACLAPGITGFLAPFLWTGRTQFWMVVPTSVFGFMLIPIAYITFALVMNSRSLLGANMPTGGRRVAWNVLMLIAVGLVAPGSIWNVWNQCKVKLGSGWYGIAAILAFGLLAVIVHFVRKARAGQGQA
ncbi:MAG: divalent metal cation transporter [Phycisphaerae bacterium]